MLLDNSLCDACGAELALANLHLPVYCIPCVEDMERLKMSPKQYRKHMGVKVAFSLK